MRLLGGNAAGHFAIGAASGEITTTAPLDFETTSSYVLTVIVTDDQGLTDTASIAVSVLDVANDDSDADGLTGRMGGVKLWQRGGNPQGPADSGR